MEHVRSTALDADVVNANWPIVSTHVSVEQGRNDMQKYPSHGRTAQRRQSRIPTCCRSRLGTIKKRFDTEKEARAKAREYEGKYDVYPCRTGEGYHIRTHRDRNEK